MERGEGAARARQAPPGGGARPLAQAGAHHLRRVRRPLRGRLPARPQPQALHRRSTTGSTLRVHSPVLRPPRARRDRARRPRRLHRRQDGRRPLPQDDRATTSASCASCSRWRGGGGSCSATRSTEVEPPRAEQPRDERADRGGDRPAAHRLPRARAEADEPPSGTGGGSPGAWWRWRSPRRCGAASCSRSAGRTWSSSTAASTCGRRTCAASSTTPKTRAVAAHARTRPPRRGRARGAWRGEPLPGRRLPRVLPPGARHAARPVASCSRSYMRPALARAGDHQAVPALARPPPHGADARGRGRQPAGVRAAQGGALAGHDHRAVHPRRPGAVPRCRAPRRGAHVRGPRTISSSNRG